MKRSTLRQQSVSNDKITTLLSNTKSNTLFMSPTLEDSMELWKNENPNVEWPFQIGWWSRLHSLCYPFTKLLFPGPAYNIIKESQKQQEILTVLMTGRIESFENLILEILDKHEMKPNVVFLVPEGGPFRQGPFSFFSESFSLFLAFFTGNTKI